MSGWKVIGIGLVLERIMNFVRTGVGLTVQEFGQWAWSILARLRKPKSPSDKSTTSNNTRSPARFYWKTRGLSLLLNFSTGYAES